MRSDAMKRQFAIHGEFFFSYMVTVAMLSDYQTTNERKWHYHRVIFVTEKMTRFRKLPLSLREHEYIYHARSRKN